MSRTNVVLQNQYGGFYTAGRPLGKAKWISVIHLYDRELEINGRSTVRKLAELASVSKKYSVAGNAISNTKRTRKRT